MIDSIIDFFIKYGEIGLFIHSFIDAFIMPIPSSFTQLAISLINPERALVYATFGFIGSIIGTGIGYWMGKKLGKPLVNKIVSKKWRDTAIEQFEKNGDSAVLIGSFTPIPFKVFTVLSGVLNFSFKKLMLYAVIGRFFKYYSVGTLFYLYGDYAQILIDKYLNSTFLFVAFLILIIVIVKRKYLNNKEERIK